MIRQLALVFLFAAGSALPGLAADFAGGHYTASGTNLDGSPYSGTADIKIISNTTCEITWVTGSTTSYGQCMGMGDVIAAGYVLGDAVGLVMYHLNPDGSLEGYWTVGGKDGRGTEALTPAN